MAISGSMHTEMKQETRQTEDPSSNGDISQEIGVEHDGNVDIQCTNMDKRTKANISMEPRALCAQVS